MGEIRQKTMTVSRLQDDERLRRIEERAEQEEMPFVREILRRAEKGLIHEPETKGVVR